MRAPAWIKLILLAALSILIMTVPAPWMLPMALAVIALIAILGASPIRLYRMLLPAIPFIVLITALQALLQGSLNIAMVSALRMTLLYLAGSAVTATTGEAEIAGTIERAFFPIDLLAGRSVGRDISTMMVLALAFIPMVREEYITIKMAQEARGIRYNGPINAIRSIYVIAVPLLYSLSRRADDIALAMEARCYGLKK